jgi:hypothetical protein
MREICETRVRYGYRRVHVLLRREGWMINQKKTRRIYRELDFSRPGKPTDTDVMEKPLMTFRMPRGRDLVGASVGFATAM